MSVNSPILLAIETATSACSVALSFSERTAERTVERSEVGNNIHSQVLLPMVQSVLLEASLEAKQIDAIAVDRGPGSFTGLRIGVGVAQGLAYGANCPMIGISSLDTLAWQATVDGPVIAGIDARMGEIYWCEYLKRANAVVRQGEIRVSDPGEIIGSAGKAYALVGNAWVEYWDQLDGTLQVDQNCQNQVVYPRAAALLELAKPKFNQQKWVSPAEFAPEYVRNNVAKKSVKR